MNYIVKSVVDGLNLVPGRVEKFPTVATLRELAGAWRAPIHHRIPQTQNLIAETETAVPPTAEGVEEFFANLAKSKELPI